MPSCCACCSSTTTAACCCATRNCRKCCSRPTWPGQQARLLCKEFYKRLEDPSNRHLDQEMCLADGSVPVLDTSLAERFPQYDPLKKS